MSVKLIDIKLTSTPGHMTRSFGKQTWLGVSNLPYPGAKDVACSLFCNSIQVT